MLTYIYRCDSCMTEFEVEQSIKEPSWIHCGICETDSLYRVIQSPIVFIKESINDNTSLLRQAQKNTENMGSYELQEKREEQRLKKIEGKQRIQNELAEKYGTNPLDLSESKKPWYRKIGVEKILKMTPTEKEQYIKTGKS